MPWRCSECSCSRVTAERRRRALGLPPLKVRDKACTPRCTEARRDRYQRERLERTRGYRFDPPPRGAPWSCSVCGKDREAANRARARAGLPRLGSRARTCSPRCYAEREARRRVARFGGRRGARP